LQIFTVINFALQVHTLNRDIYSLTQEEKNVEKFMLGVAIGMAGGALMVANNCKLRNLVKKNQDDLLSKAEQYIDSKLEKMENKVDETLSN